MHAPRIPRPHRRLVTPFLAALVLASSACGEGSITDPEDGNLFGSTLPADTVLVAPVLLFDSAYARSTGGGQFVHYDLTVDNWPSYAAVLFEPRPDLPPCGLNTRASRTWVEIYDASGQRRYGFCALSAPSDLVDIWFAVSTQSERPTGAYIELWDRARDVRVRSNVVSLGS